MSQITQTKPKYILIIMAVIGLLLCTYALMIKSIVCKNSLFILGAGLLAISSYLEKEFFFAGLESIVIINAILSLFNIPIYANAIILAFLLVLMLTFIIRTSGKITLQLIIGSIGLTCLSCGIIFISNMIMFIAGIILSIYSCLSIRAGFKVGWVFLILNIIFSIVALTQI